MGRLKTLLLVFAATVMSSGCLVLSLNPGYDDTTIGWDPNLVGYWVDADDKTTLQIDRSEWKSYRIHYVHPIETGDVTAYLTAIGNERFLDVMPLRGEDRGAFLIPVHAVLHLRLDGDRLELTPLSYEWFLERVRAGRPVPGLERGPGSEGEHPPDLAKQSSSRLAARTIRRRSRVRGVDDVCEEAGSRAERESRAGGRHATVEVQQALAGAGGGCDSAACAGDAATLRPEP